MEECKMVQRQEKEYDIVTHGNLELLIKHVNDRLSQGWNILGYPAFQDGRWTQPVTRTIYRDE
tara:strand:- start:586 stop:774 length:189 start_codon:yes stop_codon:yes gene_type:complete